MTSPTSVLIVGAGEFGLSTALHLLAPSPSSEHSYKVTILERHPSGLAPDSASCDINKVVRSDYPDLLYARFAREAIDLWKDERWEGGYHETGVLVLGDHSPTGQYTSASLDNSVALGCRIVQASDEAVLREYFPSEAPLPAFDKAITSGYLNRDGGWVEAARSMRLLRAQVEALGGEVLGGSEVVGLSKDSEGQVEGVVLSDGKVMRADLVTIATGAWTASLLPHLGLPEKLLATGQSELFLRLEEEERRKWKGNPVMVDWAAGMSFFEPTEEGLVKFAIHHAGYTNPVPYKFGETECIVSKPLTSSEGDTSLPAVPLDIVRRCKEWLTLRYPEFKEKEVVGSRMCWYTDTPDGDWLIDFHPEHKKLLFATGGSGHAFKFLPNIGTLVKQRIERTLPEEWATKLGWKKQGDGRDMTRVGERTEVLGEQRLAKRDELSK